MFAWTFTHLSKLIMDERIKKFCYLTTFFFLLSTSWIKSDRMRFSDFDDVQFETFPCSWLACEERRAGMKDRRDGQRPGWQSSWVCLCSAVAWQEPSPSPPPLLPFLPQPQNINGPLILPPGLPPASSLLSFLFAFLVLSPGANFCGSWTCAQTATCT